MKSTTWLYKPTLIAICLALMVYSVALALPGDLDTSFSGDGKIIQGFGGMAHIGYDIAVQSDGKVVVVGERQFLDGSGDVTSSDFAIARYNTNGTLDTTFSGDGKQVISFGVYDMPYSVVIQGDGKIVVGGDTCVFTTNMICNVALVRFNTNGTLDVTFSGDGKVVTDIGSRDNGGGDLAVLNGKILVAGYSYNGASYNGVVYRYNPDGTPDITFSGDGNLPIDFGHDEFLHAIMIYSGQIYVAGESGSGAGASDFIAARINPNGTLDGTFGTAGKVRTNLGGYDVANDLAISGGKVFLAGYSMDSVGNNKIAMVQYTASGVLDPVFSGDGKLTENLGYSSPQINGVTIQGGKIIVAGGTGGGTGDALLVRYTAVGDLDTTFSADGIVATNWGGAERYYSVLFKDSRIYTVGSSYVTVNRFTIAAYKP